MARDIRETLNKHLLWNPTIDSIFANVGGVHRCPFCGADALGVSWSVFDAQSRAASFSIWCEVCDERMHAAIFIPEGLPVTYTKSSDGATHDAQPKPVAGSSG